MNILSIISPLILVALLGYICTKSRWFSKEQLNALSKFTFSICIPVFVFYQMSKANFSEQINPELFAAFYLPVLSCYGLAWLFYSFFYQRKPESKLSSSSSKNRAGSAVFALGSSYSNNIIVGLPVLLAALGEQVVGIIFLIVTFHSAMLFAITSAIIATHNSQNEAKKFNPITFIKQTLNNPLIISIFSGLIFNLAGITLPTFLHDSLALISKPAITLALFILGASLAFYQVRQALALISIACFAKLILLPILVLVSSQYIFNLEPFIVTVLVILSASPTGVNAYAIAANHQQEQQTLAGIVVLSTLLCTLTIPLWLSYIL